MDSNKIILIRILTLAVLVFIAIAVLYFRFGYTDPNDVGIIDKFGRNVTCKQALIYYAEHEWGYNTNKNRNALLDFSNFTNYSIK